MLARRVREAVAEVVREQAERGIDVLNDGEMGKESYSTYVRERLTGFDGEGEIAIKFPDLSEYPSRLNRFRGEAGPSAEVG